MRINAGKHLLGAACIAFASHGVADTGGDSYTIEFQGEAREQGGDTLFYTEHHKQTGYCDGDRWMLEAHEVEYRDPDGELIATKSLDYTESQQRPSYRSDNRQFDEVMEVTNRNDEVVEIRWTTHDGEEKSWDVDMKSNAVIDSGFEGATQDNWDALLDGQRLDIEFLASTRGRFYSFRVRETDPDFDAVGDHVFRISASGWVTRWFADEIFLGYSEDRRLTDYYGQTNIPREPGENYQAHIRYEYNDSLSCAN